MTYNPNPIPKPQENLPQLYPISGSNSWAIEVRKRSHTREQESCANRTPNSKGNSWAQLGEEANLLKDQAIKPAEASKSMPRGECDNKPLPPTPELSPPPYTSKLTRYKTQVHRSHSSFPGASISSSFVARLRRRAGVKPDRVLTDLGHTQLDPKSQRFTDPLIPNLRFSQKDEGVPQRQEKTIAPLCAATGPEENGVNIGAQPTFTNTREVVQVLEANSPANENQIQLPVSGSPSEISSSPMTITNSNQLNNPVHLAGQLISEADPTARYVLEERLIALTISGRHRNKSGISREGGVRKPRRADTISETRRVHFAAVNELRRHSGQPRVIENKICMNNKQGENEVETTIAGSDYSPTECSEKAIVDSESNFSKENESNTVGKYRTKCGPSNVQ